MTHNPHNLATRRSPLTRTLESGNRLALWLALLALLSLSLFVCSVQEMREASVESADVNQSGSLRFHSFLTYGVTSSQPPNASWRPLLTTMAAIRADLRTRHRQAVAQTDRAWSAFSASLQRTDRVDWQTALQMRSAADRLMRSFEEAAKHKHDRANGFFLAGLAAAAAFVGLALAGGRNRRLREQMQAQVQERFRVLFEQSSDAHLLFDDTGITECNHAAVQMLGCRDKAEVLAFHPAVLSPEFQADGRRSLEKCMEMDALAREQGNHRFEWLYRKTGGEVFPVEVTLTPVTIGGKDTLLVVWHDLTERKAAEEQVRLLSTVAAESTNGIVITDTQQYILFVNPAFEQMSGYTLEDLRGRRPAEVLPRANTNQETRQRIREAIETWQPVTAELLNYHKNGTPYWIEMHITPVKDGRGDLTHFIAVETDITERKSIEAAAHKSQESLKNAQALAHVGSWERDDRKGTMVWSDELFRLCGLEPGAITPSMEALTTYTHPLDRQRAQERMKQAMQEGKGAEIEVRLVGADGVLRNVFIRKEILKNEAGQPIGSRATLTDVTERARALQEQAKFVSLIENSSDFIAMASFDGMLLSMNPAGRKLVGLERVEEITASMLTDFMPLTAWNWMQQDVLPSVMRADRWEGECQLTHAATGQVYDMQASFFLIRSPVSGEPMCLATVQRDITMQMQQDAQMHEYLVLVQDQNVQLEWQQQELAAANEQLETANKTLESLATTDGMTGAKNHRAFQERLLEEWKRSERTHRPFSIILLDVDKFKQYNDSFGHPEGDRVLKQVVHVLHETVRDTDFVARYGGEEFVVLLPETGVEGAMEAAERFRAAIEAQDWPLRQVTASFGVASLRTETATAQQLVDLVDKALYASKSAGRNRATHADALPLV